MGKVCGDTQVAHHAAVRSNESHIQTATWNLATYSYTNVEWKRQKTGDAQHNH